ncbi:NeuD/PglB/VioB family sugar acetyltransferase [Flavobacterium sp.]|jgi:sugar O-acyltransferase (sialic acid O-acetyltransferase NeuD family)|uniref:NeuD/PglB/VioB family sugar acetyltransferase n=1 Tax=Flavobacterium sp. TaxID=239 RepID=UPI0037BF1799
MLDFTKKIAIFGIGGLAKDVFFCLKEIYLKGHYDFEGQVVFVDKLPNKSAFFLNCPLFLEENFDSRTYQVIIAIGNPTIRKQISSSLPAATFYPKVIHPSALVNETVILGNGVVILANAIISCDVTVGDFCILDRAVQIGHDCKVADFVHFSPASVLSGNVTINSLVDIGTLVAIKQNLEVERETIIGMGAIVVKSIQEKGVYLGNPAKKIR